jgi:hypothetical protein
VRIGDRVSPETMAESARHVFEGGFSLRLMASAKQMFLLASMRRTVTTRARGE